MTVKAWSYIRLSDKSQIEGHGETRQDDLSRAYAEEHGLTLQEPLRDLGKSGFHGTHRKTGNLGRFLKLIELGLVPANSFFLVENCDRLSREDPLTAFETFTAIINAGINVVTTDDRQLYNRDLLRRDPMKLIFWIMQSIRGNAESDRKSKMVTKAANRRKEIAVEKGRAIDGRAPTWLIKTANGFKVDPAKKSVIERIFRELDQGLGCNRVAQRLNDDDIPPFNDYKRETRGWHQAVILHIARSRSVLGEHQMTKLDDKNGQKVRVSDGPPRENWWPRALDDEALFYRVQSRLTDRNKRAGMRGGGQRGRKVSNLFTGLCVCHECGDLMNFHGSFTSKAGVVTRATFKCGNAARKAGCSNRKRIDYQRFEDAVLQFVNEVELEAEERRSPAEIEIELLEARRGEADRKLANIVAKLDDDDAPASVMKLIRTREEEIEALDDQIASLREKSRQAGSALSTRIHQKTVRELLAEMSSVPDAEMYAIRARLSVSLAEIVSQIVFSPLGSQVLNLKASSVRYVLTNDKIVRLDPQSLDISKARLGDTALRPIVEKKPYVGRVTVLSDEEV